MSDVTKWNVGEIARALRDGQLSRGGLSDRTQGSGHRVRGSDGVLGVSGAHAAATTDASATLKSSNATLNGIIHSGPQAPTINPNSSAQRTAYYRYYPRYYTRHYSRYYGRY